LRPVIVQIEHSRQCLAAEASIHQPPSAFGLHQQQTMRACGQRIRWAVPQHPRGQIDHCKAERAQGIA
jgi:hypothetical protein